METRGPSNSCFDTSFAPALPAVVSPDGRWPAFGAPRREDAMVWAWSGLWAVFQGLSSQPLWCC